MAVVGDRFKTGSTCETSGSYVFDGYVDGAPRQHPSQEERVIPLAARETFPPIRSTGAAAWWKLQRVS